MGRRAGDRESQKTCRSYLIGDDGKITGLRYVDTDSTRGQRKLGANLESSKGLKVFFWRSIHPRAEPGQ
jgi:hypothetical protein